MSTVLATDTYRVQRAQEFLDDFANNSYYLFFGDGSIHTNNSITDVDNDTQRNFTGVWNSMLCGKRVTENNVVLAVRNIPYQSNVVYTMYDDKDASIFMENYYVVVNAGAFYHTFKVLDNNANTASVVQPDFSHIIGANATLYQTADGYRWKYMYSVPIALVDAFGYSDYFPYQANTTVSASAVPGSIDIIHIDYGGNYYNNYFSSTFRTADIAIGSEVIYALSNSAAATVNGYYTGCILYMTTGLAAGQYHIVADYISNTLGNFVILDTGFVTIPQNGDSFEIFPQVFVIGNGQETLNCVARALVNALATNSIYRVDILERGADYNTIAATVLCNAAVKIDTGSNTALLRPILPPKGGHGANAAIELQAFNVIVGQNLSNNENQSIIDTGGYQQIGLLRNPLFANVEINLATSTSEFVGTEPIVIFDPAPLVPNCITNTGNFFVASSNDSLFTFLFHPGQLILLSDPSLTLVQLNEVISVVNNQVLELAFAMNFASNVITLSTVTILDTMLCNTVASTSKIYVECDDTVNTTSLLIGEFTNNFASVDHINRNGVTKTFDTFNQATRLTITPLNGNFIPGEMVNQDFAFGSLQSISANGDVAWITNLTGRPFQTLRLNGLTSGASASITGILPGELKFGSGDIVYVENIDLITRSNTQSETFKIAFNF